MSLLARNTLLLTVAKFFSVAIYGLLGLVLPRHVSFEENGIYALMVSLQMFGGMIGSFGVPLVVTRELARTPEHGPRLWAHGRLAMLLGCTLSLVLLAGFLGWETSIHPATAARKWWLFVIVAVMVFAEAIGSLGDAMFQGHERMGRPAAIEIGTGFVRAGGAWMAMIFLPPQWRLEGIFVCFCLGTVWRAIVIRRLVHRELLHGASIPRASLADAWRTTKSSGAIAVFRMLRVVRNRMDLILVGALIGLASVAADPDQARSLYGMSLRLAGIFHTVTIAFTTALFPRFSRMTAEGQDLRQLHEPYARAVRWQAWWSTPLAAGLFYYTAPVNAWFGEKYLHGLPEMGLAASAALLPWLMVGTYIDCVGGPVGMLMMGVKRLERKIPWVGLLLAGSSVALVAGLVPFYGLIGAAWASCAVAGLELVVKMVIVGTTIGPPLRIITGVLPYLGVSGVMILGLQWLGLHDAPVIGAVIGGSFYLAACLLLRITDPAIARFLLQRFRRA
ncbi:MAG: oligosaccharide flippase family protein [Planctomycetota bacterium]|nr:oligosaccharide flippase family protein [Planctomycetota bacterium]